MCYPYLSTGLLKLSRMSLILRTLEFSAIPIHGGMSQSQRLGSLTKFKSGGRKILVATDIASRYVVTDSRLC